MKANLSNLKKIILNRVTVSKNGKVYFSLKHFTDKIKPLKISTKSPIKGLKLSKKEEKEEKKEENNEEKEVKIEKSKEEKIQPIKPKEVVTLLTRKTLIKEKLSEEENEKEKEKMKEKEKEKVKENEKEKVRERKMDKGTEKKKEIKKKSPHDIEQVNLLYTFAKTQQNSPHSSEVNTDFYRFLEIVEDMMKTSFEVNQALEDLENNLNLLAVNGYKPINEMIINYSEFVNKFGFNPKALVLILSEVSKYVVARNLSQGGVYYDYSQEELIYGRKLDSIIDNLMYGIIERRAFMSYEQLAVCLESLNKIGYKNTLLVEMIMQRVNYDLENNIFSFIAEQDKSLLTNLEAMKKEYLTNGYPKKIFEENNYFKSYKEKYGYWPGYGKPSFTTLDDFKVNLLGDEKFATHMSNLIKVSTDSTDYDFYSKHKKNDNLIESENDDPAVLNAALENLIREIKELKEVQVEVTDNVNSILKQYGKIKNAHKTNEGLNKIQFKYEIAKLEHLLVEAGYLKFEDLDKKINLNDISRVLRDYTITYFPSLFNLEINQFTSKLESLDGISDFKINQSAANDVNSLFKLLREISNYSESNFSEVNSHDYYNKDVLLQESDQFDNISPTFSGKESLYIETNPKYTITHDVMNFWFRRTITKLLEIANSKTKNFLDDVNFVLNKENKLERLTSDIESISNSIKGYLDGIEGFAFINEIISNLSSVQNSVIEKSKLDLQITKKGAQVPDNIVKMRTVFELLSDTKPDQNSNLTYLEIIFNNIFKDRSLSNKLDLLFSLLSLKSSLTNHSHSQLLDALIESIYSQLTFSQDSPIPEKIIEVLYIGCSMDYLNNKKCKNVLVSAISILNKIQSLEVYIYQNDLQKIGPDNINKCKSTKLSQMLQCISYYINSNKNQVFKLVDYISPSLLSSRLHKVDDSNDLVIKTLTDVLLESVYPDKIKTSSFINNQEKNKSENIHYLLELRNLNEFHYKPNLIVGYYGLKVAVFILDKTIPYYDENIKKYFNQNYKDTLTVIINTSDSCSLNLATGEIESSTGIGIESLVNSIKSSLKENEGKIFSEVSAISNQVDLTFEKIISLIKNNNDLISSEFVNNTQVSDFYQKVHGHSTLEFSNSLLLNKEEVLFLNEFFKTNKKESISDKIVYLLNKVTSNLSSLIHVYSHNKGKKLINQLNEDVFKFSALVKISIQASENSIDKISLNKTNYFLKNLLEISQQLSETILPGIIKCFSTIESIKTNNESFKKQLDFIGYSRIGNSLIKESASKNTFQQFSSKKNISLEILNNKFLWYDNYSQQADWENDIKEYYDSFNYLITKNDNKYYFNNNSLGDRFISTGIIPNPERFRTLTPPKDLDLLLESSELGKLNRINIQKSAVYKEIKKNISLSDAFSRMPIDVKLKINLLNIIHSLKSSLNDSDIISFIAKLDAIELLKKEHVNYFVNKTNKVKEEANTISSINNDKLKYLKRNKEHFIDYLAEVNSISPNKDEFSDILLQEDEKRKELLRYNPLADYEQREEELINKMEKWLEENTDLDSVFGDNNPNDPFYKLDSHKSKSLFEVIEKGKDYFKQELLANDSQEDIILTKRKESERNLIIFSIYYKLIIENISRENLVDIPSHLKLNEYDQAYLAFLKNKDLMNSTNNLIKSSPTQLTFTNLGSADIYALESLSENIQLDKLLNSNPSVLSKYSLNDLFLELAKFIDPTFIDNVITDNLVKSQNSIKEHSKNNNKMISNEYFNVALKEPILNKQKTFETVWRLNKKLNDEEIKGLIKMFFIGKDKTDYQRAWLDIDKEELFSLISEANSYDNRLDLIKKIFNRKNIEILNRKHWPGIELVSNNKKRHENYIVERKALLKPLVENLIGKKLEDIKNLSIEEGEKIIDTVSNSLATKTTHADVLSHYNTLQGILLHLSNFLTKTQINTLHSLDRIFQVTKFAEAILSTDKSYNLACFPIKFDGVKLDSTIDLKKNKEEIVIPAKINLPIFNHVDDGFNFISEINKRV